jgi:hypothetical protein
LNILNIERIAWKQEAGRSRKNWNPGCRQMPMHAERDRIAKLQGGTYNVSGEFPVANFYSSHGKSPQRDGGKRSPRKRAVGNGNLSFGDFSLELFQ